MEVNTRVQVEHPITEMVYGIDLIKEQIKIAAGNKLSFPQNLKMNGHSLECRINAEHAETFIPSPGKIDFLVLPGGQGIRVDSAAFSGWDIPPDYDSLVAKIIVHSPTRAEAIKKMQTALEMTTIVGIQTNLPLHMDILSNSNFRKGNYNIQFLEKFLNRKKAGRK
jgi:acetyl-CoA carboxylase biotin carboxylase subunit